jgi:FlaA1/EpsC-like NDP-sugar epimerase
MMRNALNKLILRLRIWSENRLFRVVVVSIQQLFTTLLITYLLLLLIETIFPASVSRYLNLNYWLIAVIVTGVITVLSRQKSEKREEKTPVKKGNITIFVCAGLIGAALIWYKTRDTGWLSYLISLAGGIIIVLLSVLVWQDDGEEESEGENSPNN